MTDLPRIEEVVTLWIFNGCASPSWVDWWVGPFRFRRSTQREIYDRHNNVKSETKFNFQVWLQLRRVARTTTNHEQVSQIHYRRHENLKCYQLQTTVSFNRRMTKVTTHDAITEHVSNFKRNRHHTYGKKTDIRSINYRKRGIKLCSR